MKTKMSRKPMVLKPPTILRVDGVFEYTTTSDNTEVKLPLYKAKTTIDWGDGTIDRITETTSTITTHTYATTGVYDVTFGDVIKSNGAGLRYDIVYGMEHLTRVKHFEPQNIGIFTFYGCSNLTHLDNSKNWDTSTNYFNNTFINCSSLVEIDAENWDTSNFVTHFSCFAGCTSLRYANIDNWIIKDQAYHMFYNCNNLEEVVATNTNFNNVINTEYMFYQCKKLNTIDVSNWDVSNTTSFDSMFGFCEELTTIDVSNWDVSSAISLQSMLIACYSLTTTGDLSNWDISNVTDISRMFQASSKITDYTIFNWRENYPGITSHDWCYYNNTSRPDYGSVPEDWK